MLTRAMATPVPAGSSRPAAENDWGATTDRPTPVTPKATMARGSFGAATMPANPRAASAPPTRTIAAGPYLRTARSPPALTTKVVAW